MILFLHDDTLFLHGGDYANTCTFSGKFTGTDWQLSQEGKNKIRASEDPVYMVTHYAGSRCKQIAEAIGWHVDTVRHVQSLYLRRGEIALKISGKGGRLRENMTVKEETQFLAPFFHMAESGGILVATDIKRAYEKRVGHQVPRSTIYRMLGRHGWRKIAPRPHHPKDRIRPSRKSLKKLHRSPY